MSDKSCHREPELSRRGFVRLLGVVGVVGAGTAGCTPLRMVLKLYPSEFDTDPELVDRTLRAFVLTVVPGLPEDARGLTRQFYDESFRLAKHRGFFAADLCERAGRVANDRTFAALPYEQRAKVIRDGLEAGGVTTKLYSGAIHLTQIACFASMYDDEAGCPLIDFEGRFDPTTETNYPDPGRFLAVNTTTDGNPI